MKQFIDGIEVELDDVGMADLTAALASLPTTPAFPPLPRAAFWLAALEVGVTKSGVLSHVATNSDPAFREQARIMIEESTQYRRDDPLIDFLSAAEGITSEQLDVLWNWALSHS